MKTAGKWTFCYAVVSNTDVWRSINPASLSGAMNLELSRIGLTVTGGLNGASNSLVVSFKQLAHLIDTYETVLQVWFHASSSFDENAVHRAFVVAWNQTVRRDYPFPNSSPPYGDINLAVSRTINGGRTWFSSGYSQVDCDIQQYTDRAPIFGATGIDRLTISNILTSNQPNLVGRDLNPVTIAELSRSAVSATSGAVRAVGSTAREVAGNLAEYGAQELQRSGLLPFSTNELQAIGSAVAVIGIAAVATYALGKAK